MNKSDILSRYLFVYLLLLLVEYIWEYHNIFFLEKNDTNTVKFILKKIAFGRGTFKAIGIKMVEISVRHDHKV